MPKTALEQVTVPSLGQLTPVIPPSGHARGQEPAPDPLDRFFRAISRDLFVIGKNIRLSDKAEVTADLLALDREGRAVLVVCQRENETAPLARGLTCAALLSAWKARNFFDVLPEPAAELLRGFLRAGAAWRSLRAGAGHGGKSRAPASGNVAERGLENINREQRLILISRECGPELVTAAEWLRKQQAVDILWFRASAGGGYQLVFPPPPPEPDLAEPAWISARFRQARELVREAAESFSSGQWITLAAVGVLLLGLGIWNVAPFPTPEEAAAETARTAEGEQTLPANLIGRVEDAATHLPIADAKVYHAGRLVSADSEGIFELDRRPEEDVVRVKAAGYRPSEIPAAAIPGTVRLEPIEVRALYLNRANLGNAERRSHVLNLIRNSSSNAIVVGFKSAEGYLAAPVDHELAHQIGALDQLPIRDLAGTVAGWKAEGIYTIALITLFKDDLIAAAAPQLALRSLKTKQVIRDQYGVAWTDPASLLVRSYNIKVAEAAAAAGFDEIQFDFVRYPAEPLSFEGAGPEENRRRLATVSQFLRRVTEVLAPRNVHVGASVFGSVCSLREIGPIGQDLEEFASLVDYISPMLYPSYFGPAANEPQPVRQSYRLVYGSLRAAAERLGGAGRKLRPWLQNFPDRASPKAPLDAGAIRAQMQAAHDAGANGWMMWDAGNRYLNTLEAMRGLPPGERSKDPVATAAVMPTEPKGDSQRGRGLGQD